MLLLVSHVSRHSTHLTHNHVQTCSHTSVPLVCVCTGHLAHCLPSSHLCAPLFACMWMVYPHTGMLSSKVFHCFHAERPLEDHECVVDVYTHWARDTNNQFLFKLMDDKYEIFEDPTVSVLAYMFMNIQCAT